MSNIKNLINPSIFVLFRMSQREAASLWERVPFQIVERKPSAPNQEREDKQ